MLKQLFKYFEKPALYSPSTSALWDDPHISKGMLEAHLQPDLEAASRSHDFIDQSVAWIARHTPSDTFRNLLDLGCGPGLYAERLYAKGYAVTGIDFSKRSIDYAKENASNKNLDIDYLYENYLDIDYDNVFDLVMLIYCDYAVLSDANRRLLLEKIYSSLKPGGKFVFDVFSVNEFESKEETHTWYVNEGSGFWKPDKHICFESHFVYENDVRLNQYVIIDHQGEASIVRNWFKGFSKETIIQELKIAGFQSFELYADVSGAPFSEESKTICIVAEKSRRD